MEKTVRAGEIAQIRRKPTVRRSATVTYTEYANGRWEASIQPGRGWSGTEEVIRPKIWMWAHAMTGSLVARLPVDGETAEDVERKSRRLTKIFIVAQHCIEQRYLILVSSVLAAVLVAITIRLSH